MGNYHSTDNAGETVENTGDQLSELFNLLADRRRRYTLYCLDKYETPMALADLTDEIVRIELDAMPTAVPEVREQVYTHLYHRHLPKLKEANLVRFDLRENLVSLGPDADKVRPYLERTMDEWPPDPYTE